MRFLWLGIVVLLAGGCGGEGGGIDIGNAADGESQKRAVVLTQVREYKSEPLFDLPVTNTNFVPANAQRPTTHSTIPTQGFVPDSVQLALSEVVYFSGATCADPVPDSTVALSVTSIIISGIGGPFPPLDPADIRGELICGIGLRFSSNDSVDTAIVKASGVGDLEGEKGLFYLREALHFLYEFPVPVTRGHSAEFIFEMLVEPEGWLKDITTWGLVNRGVHYWSGVGDDEVHQFENNIIDSSLVRLLDSEREPIAYATPLNAENAEKRISRVLKIVDVVDN